MNGQFGRGFLAGALIGVAIGLLVAPKPGRETREVVRGKAGESTRALRERFRRGRTQEDEEPSEDQARSYA